jgi:hypothetical protein
VEEARRKEEKTRGAASSMARAPQASGRRSRDAGGGRAAAPSRCAQPPRASHAPVSAAPLGSSKSKSELLRQQAHSSQFSHDERHDERAKEQSIRHIRRRRCCARRGTRRQAPRRAHTRARRRRRRQLASLCADQCVVILCPVMSSRPAHVLRAKHRQAPTSSRHVGSTSSHDAASTCQRAPSGLSLARTRAHTRHLDARGARA